MRNFLIIAILSVMVLAGLSLAAEGDAGHAGAFFNIPIGARPVGMGGAYLAVSDDGAGPLFNPAGIADVKDKLFGSSYRTMKLDRVLGYVTVIVPTQGKSALGVHWLYAGDKNLQARDDRGVIEQGFDIAKWDHAISIVFAKRLEKVFGAGVKINYLQSNFVEMSAFGVGFDLGGMFYLSELFDRNRRDLMPIQDIRLGVTVKYLGAKYRWNSENYLERHVSSDNQASVQEDKIPFQVGLGSSARFLDNKLLVAMDIVKNEKEAPFFHLGGEYSLRPELALRAGLSEGNLTAGTGFLFNFGSQKMAIDYAFSAEKVGEGSEHIFSFDILF